MSGPWRVTSVRRNDDDQRSREYLRISYGGFHVANARSVHELAKVLNTFGIALPDLVEHNRSLLR